MGQGKCGGCARKAHVLIRRDLFIMRQDYHEQNPEKAQPVDQKNQAYLLAVERI
jgi:hypothetical protein